MMRSMFSGVSGLKVHQTRMDVIGNNISNVNTVGYKAQRVTFSDVFSQTISGASSANDETGRGGTNAMQVGLGVNVSSIDMLMTQGATQRTDNPFDLMINGSGFIIASDASGQYFTRAGALRQDDNGNLVIPNGMRVQGWPATYNDTEKVYEINRQEVQDINLAADSVVNSAPSATTEAKLSGNLNNVSTSEETSISFYDSVGNYYTLNVNLNKTAANEWEVAPVTDKDGKVHISDSKGNKEEVTITGTATFKFNADGTLDTAGTTDFDIDFGTTPLSTGSTIGKVNVDITGLTQYASNSNIKSKAVDGNSAGTLTGYSVGGDGIITAVYSNGDIRPIAQVAVAEFDNPAGLEKIGDNLYAMTSNSGDFDGIGQVGNFNSGVLEMSNVDLSSEFTDMIITQRGFQANSKIITVSDEMLQELTNLKR